MPKGIKYLTFPKVKLSLQAVLKVKLIQIRTIRTLMKTPWGQPDLNHRGDKKHRKYVTFQGDKTISVLYYQLNKAATG